MKPALLSMLLVLTTGKVGAGKPNDAFYVWQQVWSSNVVAAVVQEPATTLYPLAGVIPRAGPCDPVDIPWERLSTLGHRYVPVIRIPLPAFRRSDIGTELSALTHAVLEAAGPAGVEEVQIDLDCPEGMLSDYARLLECYRREWPRLRVSITALPAHVANRAFRNVAARVDGYVLQLHGLDVPGHVDAPAILLDMETARRAILHAEALELPYRVALPCYAYELNFDPDDGRFLFLTAERPARRRPTIRRRIAAGPEDLVALQQEVRCASHVAGIVWFRLPVAGDRLCWPRPYLAAIQSGQPLPAGIECKVLAVSDTTCEIELSNAIAIDVAEVRLALQWPRTHGTYDLYADADSPSALPGQLPEELTVPLPPPGESVKIGWFQCSSNQPPSITMELQ